jgi:short-subunit dehydrogenase
MTERALVTGASSGIGAAYAKLLAERGYDLILVARRRERLQTLCEELGRQWGIQAEAYPADLSDPQQVRALAEYIKKQSRLSMIVNNAGFGTWGPLAEADVAKELSMLHVHINATFQLTHAALPAMIDRKQGSIVNVASQAAFFRVGKLTNYCASKAYIVSFSESLAKEVREHGIKVQALCPGYTSSEFFDTEEWVHFSRKSIPEKLWSTPEAVVKSSFEHLTNNHVVLTTGQPNKFMLARVIRSLRSGRKKMLLHRL